jgi:hypothetical protein
VASKFVRRYAKLAAIVAVVTIVAALVGVSHVHFLFGLWDG